MDADRRPPAAGPAPSLRETYRGMGKPRAVEEVGDIYLIRPLGFLLVLGFRRTPLSPTAVSVLGVLAGWWTAWLYYRSGAGPGAPDRWLAAAAAGAFLLHSALDSADGQLARLTGRSTPLGRVVDGFCDNLTFLAIYVAIVAAYAARGGSSPAAVSALAIAAAWSHSVQSSLADYVRTFYLWCVHGGRDLADGRAAVEKGVRPAGLAAGALHALHVAYARQQRLFLASSSSAERRIAAWLERSPGGRERLAEVYGRRERPLLPGWALLASNSHKIGIALAAFLPVVPGSFWAGLGMGWYLVYDLALSLAAAALIAAQARVDRAILDELGA